MAAGFQRGAFFPDRVNYFLLSREPRFLKNFCYPLRRNFLRLNYVYLSRANQATGVPGRR